MIRSGAHSAARLYYGRRRNSAKPISLEYRRSSRISPDMRDLLAREADDGRAAEAAALSCYQATKWVGAFTAALGGLGTPVFSAGVGEHSAPIRARICDGLGVLGIELHDRRNATHAPVTSTDTSRGAVRVIPTDEDQIIARSVLRLVELDLPTTIRDA